MDIERYLIILKGEDKTDKIRSYEYVDGWKVNVRFYKPDKTYGYAKSNFQFYSDPTEIDINENCKTLVNGDIFNVKKILRFGSYCKIIFNDDSYKTVPAGNLKLTEKVNQVSEDRFNYFKDISKIVSVRTDDGTALLAKEYENLLNEEEKKYASNKWTHIDFVIYNKMDKKMIMAIEVDGYHFHKKGTVQNERDKLKDIILQKYGVPLIRLKTTGSGEEKILTDSIKNLFEEK